jgi:LmbE family N-acetylglucosaminyl deacetylase
LREREAAAAAKVLGIDGFEFWRGKDGALKATSQIVERFRRLVVEWRPDLIYVTHDREMHGDHRAAARIVMRALPKIDAHPDVRMYEVWTPLQNMDEIVDISEHMDVKLEAVRAYQSQCDVLRFDAAVLGLNRYRGEMHSWPGGPYAEVFSHPRSS